MGKSLFIFLLLLSLAAIGQAQTPPTGPDKLVGTWLLDNSKSDPKIKYDEVKIIISYEGSEVRITRHLTSKSGEKKTNEAVFYTDGREDTVDLTDGPSKAVTQWKNERLIRSYITYSPSSRQEIETIEEWVVSKDGQTLTIEVFMQPAGKNKERGIKSSYARRTMKRVNRRIA